VPVTNHEWTQIFHQVRHPLSVIASLTTISTVSSSLDDMV